MAHNTKTALASQAKNDLEFARSNPRTNGPHGATNPSGLAFCLGGSPLFAFLCGCGSASAIALALKGQGLCPVGQPPGCPISRLTPNPGSPPVSNTGASTVEHSRPGSDSNSTNDKA